MDLQTISVAFITGPTKFNQGIYSNTGDKEVTYAYASSTEICRMQNWKFTFDLPVELESGDHIVLKFPSTDMFFLRNGATSSCGDVKIVDNYDTNEIYYIIKIFAKIEITNGWTFTLNNIRNPGKD